MFCFFGEDTVAEDCSLAGDDDDDGDDDDGAGSTDAAEVSGVPHWAQKPDLSETSTPHLGHLTIIILII